MGVCELNGRNIQSILWYTVGQRVWTLYLIGCLLIGLERVCVDSDVWRFFHSCCTWNISKRDVFLMSFRVLIATMFLYGFKYRFKTQVCLWQPGWDCSETWLVCVRLQTADESIKPFGFLVSKTSMNGSLRLSSFSMDNVISGKTFLISLCVCRYILSWISWPRIIHITNP